MLFNRHLHMCFFFVTSDNIFFSSGACVQCGQIKLIQLIYFFVLTGLFCGVLYTHRYRTYMTSTLIPFFSRGYLYTISLGFLMCSKKYIPCNHIKYITRRLLLKFGDIALSLLCH